jgi:hypothetical protein
MVQAEPIGHQNKTQELFKDVSEKMTDTGGRGP